MAMNMPGVFSGIDTGSLIKQLVELQKRTLYTYQARKIQWQEKGDALGEVEGKLSALRSAARALSDADKLKAFSTTSSDSDILTAEAATGAFEGNHSVEINQLANAERWVHSNGLEYVEDLVGAGTFIYTYNNKQAEITTTAATTLEDLAGLINNDPNNPGVSASLLYYNDAYHLVMNGKDAGTDFEISIDASSREIWKAGSVLTENSVNAGESTLLTSLDQFGTDHSNPEPLEGGEVIEITGTDHNGVAITQVNLTITANTKIGHILSEINDAFDGVAKASYENGEIILTDLTDGASGLSINLNYNANGSAAVLALPSMLVSTEGGSSTASLAGFAAADFVETQSAQDCQIRVDGYPSGEWISRSSNTIDDVIQGVTLHLHDTGTIEVNLTRDTESVKEKLIAMKDAYNVAVSYIKEQTKYDQTSGNAGVLMADYVISTIKAQLRMPLISQTNGFVNDTDSFLNPGHIGLEIDKDGILSLDGEVFDEAIAEDYMAVLELIGADKSGTSDSNEIGFYSASSDYTTAGAYDVQVDYDGSGNVSAVRIKLQSESSYRNMTINGNVAIGDSSFTDGSPDYAENGLALTIATTGTANSTSTATVNVKQGFTGQVEQVIDKMLKFSTGSLIIDQDHVKDQLEQLSDKIEQEEYRVTKREERLIAKYARLEKTLALLQSQMSALGMSMGTG